MCDCRSYNGSEYLAGSIPERILPYRKYFPESTRETVCVDDCIADMIVSLWEAGVMTVACCCGHNGHAPIANGNANVMISDPKQAALAHEILSNDSRRWWVTFWAGQIE